MVSAFCFAGGSWVLVSRRERRGIGIRRGSRRRGEDDDQEGGAI